MAASEVGRQHGGEGERGLINSHKSMFERDHKGHSTAAVDYT